MTTRSKSKDNKPPPLQIDDDGDDSVDEHGNLKGFIDYDCKDDFDHDEFDKQVNRLSGGILKPKEERKNNKKIRKNSKLIKR